MNPLNRARLLAAHQARRNQRQRADVGADTDTVAADLDQPDPQTHFGMGSGRYPVSEESWIRTLQEHRNNRGGIRRLAESVLPEVTLVINPVRKRLVLPPGARNTCNRKHFGHCPQNYTAIPTFESRYSAVLENLKALETEASCGNVKYRFYLAEADSAEGRDKSVGLMYSFANLRRRPRYRAVYFKCVASQPFREHDCPFYLCEQVVDESAVKQFMAFDDTRLQHTLSWQLAAFLAEQFEGPVLHGISVSWNQIWGV